ncbi:permease [Egibacter rhizosphaerae]|uniref:Permease n=1 Tax=Egibacter rhizosphaerae TaxID=1670831 RepID=A0A411YAE5_9ACTN|nr:Bax inhibitor-1 family protein [Egibacter rhizosphaerae]QBI18190.1 permease [Egibacter rhizosphaerae]
MSDMGGGATATRPVSEAAPGVRTGFMSRDPAHLVGGIAAFIVLQWWMFDTGVAQALFEFVAGTSWLIILGGFMIVSWLATRLSYSARSTGAAYGAYALLIAANATIFAPLLFLVTTIEQAAGAVTTAAQLSAIAFVVLSAIAIKTSKDFSFLRGILMWGFFIAIALIVGSVFLGAALGTWFAVAMVGLAGAAILYDTQRIYHQFPPELVVPAAMHLFSSVALLFWYVLLLVMGRD